MRCVWILCFRGSDSDSPHPRREAVTPGPKRQGTPGKIPLPAPNPTVNNNTPVPLISAPVSARRCQQLRVRPFIETLERSISGPLPRVAISPVRSTIVAAVTAVAVAKGRARRGSTQRRQGGWRVEIRPARLARLALVCGGGLHSRGTKSPPRRVPGRALFCGCFPAAGYRASGVATRTETRR